MPGATSPLRLERDQHDVVFAEVELFLKLSVAANHHGADFERPAAVVGFDFGDLRLRELPEALPGVVLPLNTVMNSQFTVAVRTISSIHRAYNKVTSVIDTIQTLAGIAQALRSGQIQSLMTTVLADFAAAQWTFGVEDVIDNFELNAQRILSSGANPVHPFSWPVGIAARYARGQRISALLIYMPSPKKSSNGGFVRTGLKIGKLPVKLRFGGDKAASSAGGTRVLGGGVMFGSKATGGVEQQLFRMDVGNLHPGHGNPANTGAKPKANEIAIWDDLPFHYHVIGVIP